MIKSKEYCQLLDSFFGHLNFKKALEVICQKKYKDFEYQEDYTRRLSPLFQEYFNSSELELISALYDDDVKQHDLFDKITQYHKEILSRSVFMMIKIHESSIKSH